MSLIKSIKSFKWGYLLVGTIMCAVGLCFIIYPSQSTKVTSFVIGFTCLAMGIINTVRILSNRNRGFAFAISIIVSVCVIICGIIAFIFPDSTTAVYPMIIGLLIVIDGSFKLQTVINAKRYRLKTWWFLLIVCCIAILAGFLLIRLQYPDDDPTAFIIFFGASLIIDGLQNLFSLFFLGRITKRATEHLMYASENECSTEDAVCADASNDE